jgi:hypothetical protein
VKLSMEGRANMSTTKKSTTVLTVSLSPAFKLVFLAVLGLTIICLITSFRAGRPMTKDESGLFELGASTFKLGFGAIIGLLGGKAL